MPYYISQQPLNPVARVFAALFAVLALAGAFFFGLILLAVLVGVALVFWVGLRIRMWWLMRRMPASEIPAQSQDSGPSPERDAIDAEYTVVSKNQDP